MDLSEFDIDFLSQKLSDNPQSPLFARLADIYLTKNQASEALKLCEAGVQVYSSYATGYVVLGKCYLALNENSKARLAFSQALHLAPFNQVARKMLEEIPFAGEEPADLSTVEPATEPSAASEVTSDAVAVTPEFSGLQENQNPPADTIEITPESSGFSGAESSSGEALGVTPEFSADSGPEQAPLETIGVTPEFTLLPEEEVPSDIGAAGLQPVAEESPQTQLYENPQTAPPAEGPDTVPGVDEYLEQKFDAMAGEGLLSLDEYLAGTVPSPPSVTTPPRAVVPPPAPAPAATPPPPPPSAAELESIAVKLESAERIVPAEPEPPPRQQESSPLDSTVITPTLAEIYASQGEYGAAIQAYEILLLSKPGERERFEKRIKELQAKLFEGA